MLKDFYNQLQTWIENGFTEHRLFNTRFGVCGNLESFLFEDFDDWENPEKLDSLHQVVKQLVNQFLDAELHRTYPFNEGNYKSYDAEYDAGTLWKNAQRLAWVRSHSTN